MTTLSVPDMSCGHCKATVEAALAKVEGTGSVTVDLSLREVTVSGTAAAPALLAALDGAGYPAAVLGQ